MVFHAAVAQQHITDKQMPLKDSSLIIWKSRRGDGEVTIQGLHQRLGHGANISANIATVPTVKRRAVLKVNLFCLLRLQPMQGFKRLRNCLLWGDGPRFQRNHNCIAV